MTLVKPHLPAGDMGDDQRAIRKEIIQVKTELGKRIEVDADKILKKPRKERRTSVSPLQGGKFESNRRKF